VEIFGTAAGYVMEFEDGQKVYAAGDTGLTADMKFVVADYHKPDIALLPVIGHLSMEPEQAAYAARVVGCKYVIPFHDFPKDPSQAADPDGYREFFKRAAVAESYRKVERFMALMEKDYPEIEAIYIPIGGTVDIG
jgi:L-ascorbate metabolism protein UlaG (beta-lactamase superfamily)